MDLLTRLAGDSVWFVSTTAASLDVTVILVSLLTFAICAGLAVLLFSFFKEQSFEDGLKASRARTEDKETRRKQQEEKEAAKQRANQLKKARKANKKTESANNIDVDVPQEPAKKQVHILIVISMHVLVWGKIIMSINQVSILPNL